MVLMRHDNEIFTNKDEMTSFMVRPVSSNCAVGGYSNFTVEDSRHSYDMGVFIDFFVPLNTWSVHSLMHTTWFAHDCKVLSSIFLIYPYVSFMHIQSSIHYMNGLLTK